MTAEKDTYLLVLCVRLSYERGNFFSADHSIKINWSFTWNFPFRIVGKITFLICVRRKVGKLFNWLLQIDGVFFRKICTHSDDKHRWRGFASLLTEWKRNFQPARFANKHLNICYIVYLYLHLLNCQTNPTQNACICVVMSSSRTYRKQLRKIWSIFNFVAHRYTAWIRQYHPSANTAS